MPQDRGDEQGDTIVRWRLWANGSCSCVASLTDVRRKTSLVCSGMSHCVVVFVRYSSVKHAVIILVTAVITATFAVSVCADEVASVSHPKEYYGNASWYGAAYRGRRTASGERFDPRDFTAAHPTLPFGTLIEVARPERNRRVVVRVNDRGPGGGRLLDLSEAAARRLGMLGEGMAAVSMQVIGAAD